MEHGTLLQPGRHQLCQTGFQRHLERDPMIRQMGQPLVSVWDDHRKTFSVGIWANRLSGRFIGLVQWKPPQEPGPDDLLTVLFNLDPDRRRRNIQGWLDHLDESERADARRIADDAAEEHRLRRSLMRKLPAPARSDPRLISVPLFPGEL